MKNDFQDLKITFDGDEYHFIAYDENGDLMFDSMITEEYVMDC
ncbi:hypothetical protein [Methanobrevibacter sp.]